MKKFIQLTILSILLFVPIFTTNAITQNQIDAEVQIICPDGGGNWYSGSGTIIDPKGIILTNKHVVQGAHNDTCVIGFVDSTEQEPDFGTQDNPHLAEVKYETNSEDMDAAILYLENPNNKEYPYVNIWDSNSSDLQLGDKIETVGFPNIGGSTVTYTSGDFSGFGSESYGTQNYIKTTAVLEHGNSGGAAYDSEGDFIGIPTGVIVGQLGSLGYILSVDSIKGWMDDKLGDNYKKRVASPETINTNRTENIEGDVTPPSQDTFDIGFYGMDENGKEIYYGHKTEGQKSVVYEYPRLRFTWQANCVEDANSDICINDDEGRVTGYYYYFGNNPNAIPKVEGKYISQEQMITPNKQQARVKLPEILEADEKKSNYFILQAVDDSGNVSNPIINFEYIYVSNNDRDIEGVHFYNKDNDIIGEIEYPDPNEISSVKNYPNVPDSMWLDYTSVSIETSANTLKLAPYYDYNINGLIYYLSYGGDDDFAINDSNFREGNRIDKDNFVIKDIRQHEKINVYIKPNKNSANAFKGSNKLLEINYNKYVPSNSLRPISDGGHLLSFQKLNNDLIEKLKGKILLQTKENGEAYYVNPEDKKRYFLGRPADAFDIMRELGVGISEESYNSFDGYAPENLSGRILLRVENNGEAYYVNPEDLKMHYLGRPADAFEVMRNLGLGITNKDLKKIPSSN